MTSKKLLSALFAVLAVVTVATDSVGADVALTNPEAAAATTPNTINKFLSDALGDSASWRILDGLVVAFKTFQSDSTSLALGISYDLSKDLIRSHSDPVLANQSGISFSLNAEGNVAFDRSTNPRDFLDSNLSFHWFSSRGGVISVTEEVRARLDELEEEMIDIDDPDELASSQAQREFYALTRNAMSTQTYFDLSGAGGLESNQDFTLKQYYFGLNAALDVKPWNPNAFLAKANIFDWPFALVRLLTNTDPRWEVQGSSFPTALIGVDYVEPHGDSPRKLLGEDSGYTRVRAEVQFKTLFASAGDLDAYFDANFRYYRELGASDAVKNADLEDHLYFVMALTMSNGAFVSYSTGRLPFAVQDDQVYDLGFKYSF